MKKLLNVLLLVVAVLVFGCSSEGTKSAINSASILEEVQGVTIPKFSVTINDKVVTNEDLAEYPIYKSQVTSVNSSGTESTVNYVGFKFVDCLDKLGLAGDKKYIEAIADDGYSVKYEGRDINSMLIAISKDGSQFKKNPWFCPCDSNVTGEFLQGLTTILVNEKDEKPNLLKEDNKSETGETSLLPPDKSDKTDKVVFSDFKFKVNGNDVTNSDLEGLHIYKISCDALNSKEAVVSSTYTGYVLKDVLEKLGFSSVKNVTVIANDGYKSELAENQFNSEYTLIAIEKDKELGVDGTIWVAPCEETATKKYASKVIEINVE